MPRRALLLALILCAACEEPAAYPQGGPIEAPLPVSPGGANQPAIARWFPLVEGHIYEYEVEGEDGTGRMVTRVTRADDAGGELQGPLGTKAFRYAGDGVVHDNGAATPVYVLKEPLTVGNSWRGDANSTVSIVEIDAAVKVPAGSYRGCIKTLEERGGDAPLRIATTFCPETGIVLLEAASGAAMERVALRSYGPPVDLGPDGVDVKKVSPSDGT
jgi:hypothetical protein